MSMLDPIPPHLPARFTQLRGDPPVAVARPAENPYSIRYGISTVRTLAVKR